MGGEALKSPLFSWGTGLCLGSCEARVDLLLEKESVSDVPEKGDRSERAGWGRMLTSVMRPPGS